MVSDMYFAPLAHCLKDLSGGSEVHNFHAVPWARAMRHMPQDLASQYRSLLVRDTYIIDSTWVGGAVDSFFAPVGPLAEAQRAAARAFGADMSFFGTNGTTLSNRIAIEAVCPYRGSVLMDPVAHQSAVFATQGRAVTRMPQIVRAECCHIDVVATVELLAQRTAQGRPFDAIVLTACHYDGRRVRLEHVLPLFHEASPQTALVIDEAWSAIYAFGPKTAGTTALSVCRQLDLQATVIVTQSAHKTMAALRQATYLHLLGGSEDIRRLEQAIYRNHSTSASWPILASLDLARLHGERCGAEALSTAYRLCDQVIGALEDNPILKPLVTQVPRDAFHELDPLVVQIKSPAPPRRVQKWLFERHRILIAHSKDTLVARMNIGVCAQDTEALLTALLDLVQQDWCERRENPEPVYLWREKVAAGPPAIRPQIGSEFPDYIIPYPPGVPLVHPGEHWTSSHADRLAHAQARGAEIHQIPPVSPVPFTGDAFGKSGTDQ